MIYLTYKKRNDQQILILTGFQKLNFFISKLFAIFAYKLDKNEN